MPKYSPLAETNQSCELAIGKPVPPGVGQVSWECGHFLLCAGHLRAESLLKVRVEKGNTVIRLSKLARGCDICDQQDREEATA